MNNLYEYRSLEMDLDNDYRGRSGTFPGMEDLNDLSKDGWRVVGTVAHSDYRAVAWVLPDRTGY